MILSTTETFRREKSARNTFVSSTREFWDLRLKTKSANFFEVRWRPNSPKESFLDDFVLILTGLLYWERPASTRKEFPLFFYLY